MPNKTFQIVEPSSKHDPRFHLSAIDMYMQVTVSTHGSSFPSCRFPVHENKSVRNHSHEMCFICTFIFMQIKLTFIIMKSLAQELIFNQEVNNNSEMAFFLLVCF